MDGIALLNEWLRDAKMSPAQFARALGTSPANVSLWRSGKRSPNRQYALRIESLTRSRVPAGSWDRDPTFQAN